MRELNKVKVFIFISIVLVIICVLAFIFYVFSSNNKTTKVSNTYTDMYDSSNTLKITVPDNLNFKKLENPNYVLSIYSDINITINIAKIEKKLPNTLKEYISADKNTFPSKFENSNNISDIEACNTTNFLGYTYSFSTNNNLIKICWFEYNNYFYVLDIKIPHSQYSNYEDTLNSIIHSVSLFY